MRETRSRTLILALIRQNVTLIILHNFSSTQIRFQGHTFQVLWLCAAFLIFILTLPCILMNLGNLRFITALRNDNAHGLMINLI